MSENTPTTKRVHDLYAGATAWDFGDHLNRPDLVRMRDQQWAEFDRWLNAERARIWDEGATVPGCVNPDCGACSRCITPPPNPYRSTP